MAVRRRGNDTITPYNGTNGAINVYNDYRVSRGFSDREQRAGYESVERAAAQPWSDGNLGMWARRTWRSRSASGGSGVSARSCGTR